MAEEFDSSPTFIERSLSAPTMSVYDSFQDFLPSNLPSRLNSKYNSNTAANTTSSTTTSSASTTTGASSTTTTTTSSSSSHYNTTTDSSTDETSYLAALTDLDILDDSHVAQIKSLVIDPAKTFDYIPNEFRSSSPLFSGDDKPSSSPSLQPDETDELADVLTGIDQTTLSFQDLYVNDDEPHTTNDYQRPHSDSTGSFTNSNAVPGAKTSTSYQYASQNNGKTRNNANHHLYSPSSSIYPSLSPTEGDIRGNAPPFTLGTPGGGYQGIQAHYHSQNMSQSNSSTEGGDGMYSTSPADGYGNTPPQTAASQPGQFIPLDMSGGVAVGLGANGHPMDPQQIQAMNNFYLAANSQQGMFPEYFMGMTPQGYVPVMAQGQDESSQMYTTGPDGMNYMAFPGQQGQQQMYWAQQAAFQQQQYQHQQHLMMMQQLYQQTGDYSGLQAAINGQQQMMYGHAMNGMPQMPMVGHPQSNATGAMYHPGNQNPQMNGAGMMPMMGQQTGAPQMNGFPTPDPRGGNLPNAGGFMMPNGMVVPFAPGYPMDSYATHALLGQQMMQNGFQTMPRGDGTDSMTMGNAGPHSSMPSHPSLTNLHRSNNNQDRRNQISRVNSTGRLSNHNNNHSNNGSNSHNNSSNGNLMSLNNNASRDAVVEDFRSTYGKGRQWEIKDLVGHVVAFCQDQHGSRFIQQRLEVATPVDKQLVFDEVITNAQALITDVFGNYVIQKLFEFGSPEQCETLATLLTGQAVNLALQMYGCRVIQKALEYVQTPRLLFLVGEFEGQQVLKCVHDQNGNHVIQKCIEVMSRVAKSSSSETADFLNSRIQYIIHSFQGRVKELSMHPYGCRVVQRILEHCTNDQKGPVLEELRVCCRELIQDQYGNYVIQHMIQHGWETDQAVLMKEVHSKLLEYSQHKFASNVVEKCIQFADKQNRDEMIWTIINVTFDLNNPVDAKTGQCVLENMVRDPYANYVVQKVIDVSNDVQRGAISRYVRENIVQLRRYTYGKHIIVRLERVSGEKF